MVPTGKIAVDMALYNTIHMVF